MKEAIQEPRVLRAAIMYSDDVDIFLSVDWSRKDEWPRGIDGENTRR
jgi:hypothetical protein